MSSTTRSQRRYDHHLQALVQSTRDIGLAIQHGVPRSTARGWLTRTSTEVVTLDVLELDTVRLQHEVLRFRRRIAQLVSLLVRNLLQRCESRHPSTAFADGKGTPEPGPACRRPATRTQSIRADQHQEKVMLTP